MANQVCHHGFGASVEADDSTLEYPEFDRPISPDGGMSKRSHRSQIASWKFAIEQNCYAICAERANVTIAVS
jgi:hypothetical protein